MIWNVEIDDRARKELRKLDKQSQQIILKWLKENISTNQDPRRLGKSLKGRLKGLWRYRIGDYRAVCQIQDTNVIILVVRIAHRKDIYNK